MMIGAGFVYALGVFSGLVLAGLAVLIYLQMTYEPTDDDNEVEQATARAEAAVARLTSQTTSVRTATEAAKRIEPGE